jgi:intracellular septation protein
MKFLNDYFSILCFFITWMITKSIYTATAVGMASSGLQLAVLGVKYRQFKPIRWTAITFLFWLVFGGLTLIFHNQKFIQWKPSILYWCFGIAFLVSQYWNGSTLYEKMLQGKIKLPPEIWRKLNMSWVIFFALMGVLNLIVVYEFSLKIWIYYKIFGTIVITLLFAIGQAIYLNKHMHHEKIEEAPNNEK